MHKPMQKPGLRFVLAVLLLAALPAWAGPPFVTDDPEPVDYKHYETYLAWEQTGNASGHSGTTLLEVNYGAAPDLQVSATLPYAFNTPSGQVRQQGVGDAVFGVKYRFQQETDKLPMMAVYPVVVAATGDSARGLGNGGTQIFLPIWLQKSWGAWHSYGGGGYWLSRAKGAGSHWYFGWALLNDVTENLTLGGEAYHATDQRPFDNAANGYSLGAIYKLDEHNRLLASAGRSVVEISSQSAYTLYAAYSLTW